MQESARSHELPVWSWSAVEQIQYYSPHHLIANERSHLPLTFDLRLDANPPRYLPEEMVLGGPFAYITVLRDPLDRSIEPVRLL